MAGRTAVIASDADDEKPLQPIAIVIEYRLGEAGNPSGATERMHLGVDFIYTRYGDPIGLRDIADAARLSQFHFLRTFKSVYGMTPSTFLNRTRASKALRLLRTTSLSVTAIADQVGFGSRTSLFRHMVAIYGSSPANLKGVSGPPAENEENLAVHDSQTAK